MGISKLSLKHVQGEWYTGSGVRPTVTDWGDNVLKRATVIRNDNVLISLHAVERLAVDTTPTGVDLSGASALRAIVRASKSSTAQVYGFQTSYNQGEDTAVEDLPNGKVTWNVGVGPLLYAITDVSTGSKTFMVSGSWAGQFTAAETFTVSGSTGNDGTYTVASATYDAGDDETDIVVDEAVPSAVADGNLQHSALQNATFDADGLLTAYLECSYTDASGNPQTLLPAFELRIHVDLETGATGVTASVAATYYTAAELAAMGLVPTTGAGAAAGTNVTATEKGTEAVHRTELTLAATPITLTDEAGVVLYGGAKIYDLPAGNTIVLGAVLDLDVTVAGNLSATAEGDVALGTTTAGNDATLDGTEACLVPSTAIPALVASTGAANARSFLTLDHMDGTGTALDVYLNFVWDDADHDGGTMTVTGTVYLTWINLGDF